MNHGQKRYNQNKPHFAFGLFIIATPTEQLRHCLALFVLLHPYKPAFSLVCSPSSFLLYIIVSSTREQQPRHSLELLATVSTHTSTYRIFKVSRLRFLDHFSPPHPNKQPCRPKDAPRPALLSRCRGSSNNNDNRTRMQTRHSGLTKRS